MQARKLLVERTNANALDAAQLIDRAPRRRLLPEAHPVHRTDDAQSRTFVQRSLRLVEQTVGARSARLAGSIESNPSLSNPHEQTSDARSESDGRVRDSRA